MLDSAVIRGTTVAYPGYEFHRSGYHNFWWGQHYRKEWTTPVRVKNFYLDSAKGGLTIQKEGGGRQSSGLRLKDKNGQEYVLRSIDKDFRNGLPEMYRKTFIGHIAKDQSSISYPFAATTITPMIEATGIYHTNPQVIFLPVQKALGDYNKEFGNQLYLFEERADGDEESASSFGNSKNVIGTDKLFEKIYEDNDNHIDQKAFAKARLFDMFIGDWARQPDQWRWARFEEGDQNIYRPIPRDRDQSYTTFDGFFPWVATNLFGAIQLESFDKHLNNVKHFNTPGRPLDRQFTNELTKQEWITIANELKKELTDAVIEKGMHQLPPAQFAIHGESIIAKLKARRNELDKYAAQYYDFLSHHVDIVGSQKKELFEINRLSREETQVNIYKITKNGEVNSRPYYSRTFRNSETKEIRLFGLESTDVFKVNGPSQTGVKIRIIDPENQDSLLLARDRYNKISRGDRYEFDTFHQKKFDFSISPLVAPPEYKYFDNDPLELFTRIGLRFSVNFRYNTQPWRKTENEDDHLISVSYGLLRRTLAVGYVGTLRRLFGQWDGILKARYDVVAVQNFYGIGNNTLNDTKNSATYYSSYSDRFYAGAGVARNFGRFNHFESGIFFQRIRVNPAGAHYISSIISADQISVDPAVFAPRQFAGVEAGYRYNHVDNNVYPHKGVRFALGAGYVDDLQQPSRSFLKGTSSLAFYIPLGSAFTLALRAGGATVSNDADYYHLSSLGGNMNLRGYPRERFLGKTSFYDNNELRWITNTNNYLFSGKIGLLAFYDRGRVWYPGEVSNIWHSGYGGGLIVMPFNRIAFTGTYGKSHDGTQISLQSQVFF